MYNYEALENKLNAVLSLLEPVLSEAELAEVRHFIEVAEYGEAFDTLCAILDEEQAPISLDVYRIIEGLASQMKYEQHSWEHLRKLLKE